MAYKAVKKKRDSWISKNIANLQRNFRKKIFLDFYVDYNGLCLKKRIDMIEDSESQFNSWSHHFYKSWKIESIVTHLGKKSASSVTSLNFWMAESAFWPKKLCHAHKNWLLREKFAFTCIKIG